MRPGMRGSVSVRALTPKFYNGRRPHQSLGYRTPDEIYFGTHELTGAAA